MISAHMKLGLQRFFNNVTIVVACLILVGFISTMVVGLWVENAELPKFLGNSPKTVDYINSRIDSNNFSFIVVGDVKGGTETFEALLDISELDKPAFVIVLGDFVSNPDLIRHKLFEFEMADHVRDFPMFVVPGNHDISPDGPFRVENFEKMWGPAQFYFMTGKNLFIILNNPPLYAESGEFINFLEQTLRKKAKEAKNIFVFMHVPPSGLNQDLICNSMPQSGRFFELAKKYNVNYVFAGDHHGYVKTQKDNTTFIVTGGGGSPMRGIHGRFYHVVRIEVKGAMIAETVLATPKHLETLELIENNMAVYLWPLIKQNPMSIGITIMLLGVTGWLLVFSIKRRKHLNYLVQTAR